VPITVFEPAPGQFTGLGYFFEAESSFIGPILDPYWNVSLMDTDQTVTLWTCDIPAPLSAPWHTTATLQLTRGETALPIARSALPNGSNALLQVQLNGSAGFVEGMNYIVKSDLVTTLIAAQTQLQGEGSGGFSAEDRAQLELSVANTQASIPSGAGSILHGIGDLLNVLPSQWTNRHGSIVISGQGSLSRGSEPFRLDSLGIEWHWHTVPPEAGKLVGDPDVYTQRVVQFRTIFRDSALQLYQGETIEAFQEGDRKTWGLAVPETLEYFVRPGWEVELSFLVVAFG
jgi:hypothetical protein